MKTVYSPAPLDSTPGIRLQAGGSVFHCGGGEWSAHAVGEVADGETRLNEFGRIVERAWTDLQKHYSGVQCDEFVVMPNHIHGIIVLGEPIVGRV